MTEQKVYVLRLGHRIGRDKRASMHIFLTARALSASGVVYSGDKDGELEEGIEDAVKRWGGPFKVSYEDDWRDFVNNWRKKGAVCHLTMYGTDITDCLDQVPKDEDLLVVVGSQKVPKEIFQLADFNIAIGNQPHSEVAALAIFLDRLFERKGLKKEFENAQMKVVSQSRGKKVARLM